MKTSLPGSRCLNASLRWGFNASLLSRDIGIALVLCIAAAAQRQPAPSNQLPPSAYKLISVKVTGSTRFTTEDVAAASGLPMGTVAHEDDFKKAARQLGESGAFTSIAFTFSSSSAGTKLEFQVTDADKFVPARFTDFVWLTDDELRQKLHERIPLFHGELPANGRLPDEVDDVLQVSAGRVNPLPTSSVISNEPGSRYIDFLIPGLIGMNLMNSGMWSIGFALVDMRQRKLLKRYVATPMRRSDFLLALAGGRLVLMVIEVGLLLGFGALIFHIRVLGSLFSILVLSAIGAVGFAGLGLLTASRAQKIESVSGLINLIMMPMWIFSGVFFSYERFPAAIHPFIKALPLTALNDALRATILEGAPLTAQAGRLLVLMLWGGVSFALALRWFRWT